MQHQLQVHWLKKDLVELHMLLIFIEDLFFFCILLSRPLPPIGIMHTSPVLISAATMSNMTVLDTADPYDMDMTSDGPIYPISFQVMLQPHISDGFLNQINVTA